MRVSVTLLYQLGRRHPQREWLRLPQLIGDVGFCSATYKGKGMLKELALRKPLSTAPDSIIARLFEPQLVAWSGHRMRFAGIEAIDGAGFVQEWLVEIL